MLPAKLLLDEIVTALRQVIGPAISEPYPKSQAYMAATILDSLSRQMEERGDRESQKTAILHALFDDLTRADAVPGLLSGSAQDEAALAEYIERLYLARAQIGEIKFEEANHRVRRALRALLELELEVAGKAGQQ